MAPEALARVIIALIAEELGRLRGRAIPAADWSAWGPETRLDEDGIGADSVALIDLAARVNTAFHLHEVGSEDYLLVRRSVGEWVEVVRQSLAMRSERLTFFTSGSTGALKQIVHERARLEAEAAIWAERFEGAARVLTLVPPHHIYGFLFTALLPEQLSAPVIDLRTAGPGAAIKTAQPGDVIIATPFLWDHIAKAPGRFGPEVQGVSAGAALGDDLFQVLLDKGLWRLTDIYGATETAGVGWRDKPGAPFALLPGWRLGEAGLHRMETGQAIETPDDLKAVDAGRFQVAGRRDGAVQIAGVNVFPDAVAARLSEAPFVEDAAIRLMSRAEAAGGERRLKAFIVPAEDAPANLLETLEILARQTLKAPERPVRFTLGEALPTTETGKPADWPAGDPAQAAA